MKLIWVLLGATLLVGCHNDQNVPRADDRVRTETGNKGATPNQSFTVSNSSQQTSVPREGGNLDRGATRDNDPSRNAPGSGRSSPTLNGPGTGPATK
jgi:hypothetical protein